MLINCIITLNLTVFIFNNRNLINRGSNDTNQFIKKKERNLGSNWPFLSFLLIDSSLFFFTEELKKYIHYIYASFFLYGYIFSSIKT